jgi:hypothetical protein
MAAEDEKFGSKGYILEQLFILGVFFAAGMLVSVFKGMGHKWSECIH